MPRTQREANLQNGPALLVASLVEVPLFDRCFSSPTESSVGFSHLMDECTPLEETHV
jgi:hypothetical protein